jgi:alpha-mannosidase
MDHERTNQGMLLYGYGDGGGGPTRHMLEVLKRVKDFQGIPRTVQRTAQEFFKKLKANIRDVNVIKGELYFELHRGTYTSQAANKKGNRDSERVLREVEMLASLSGSEYPSAELERLWKIVLLNQFHDILPGSSINEVYQDSAKDYAEVKKSLGELRKSALKNLLRSGEETIIVNTCGWKRTGLIELGKDAKVLPSAIAQKSHDGKIIAEVSAPSVGTARLGMDKASGKIATLTHKKNLYVLENDFIVAEFLASGSLIRLQEKKSGREMIENGESANQFVLFDDRPVAWDAWDVDPFHLETRKPIPAAKSVKVLENGPLRVGLEFFYSFGKSGKSSLSQKVFLENRSGVLAFDNELDWHEQHQFLKVEFPVAVKSMDASYEIQFGHLKRATHFNTSFEVARFEANAHKWIDLSEPEFGVSLFTDCKYGYAVHDSTMRISLVRGPTSPDPMADQGKHHFRFACYPHAGDLIQAETVRRAHEFNQPWISVQGSGEEKSFVSVSSPHLVIDTVKKSEVGNALIVRLYETHGARGKATLKVPTGFKKASLVNLMEEQAKPVSLSSDVLTFKFRAFEVITVKLEK